MNTERHRGESNGRLSETFSLAEGLTLDLVKLELGWNGEVTKLSPNQNGVLVYLFTNGGEERYIKVGEILSRIWDDTYSRNIVVVTVGSLKNRLNELGIGDMIMSKRRKGYKLDLSVLQKKED